MKNTKHCSYRINSYDVGPRRTARLTSIANILQETAYRHASELELGYHHLAEKNRAWILSRMRIRMHRYPTWDDEIEIETWPHGVDKLFALRDFVIRSTNGEVIGEAMTCWLMADLQTHRPLRINPDFIKVKTREDSVFDATIGKISLPENMAKVQSRRAVYSDLDVVDHVNNVKYIEWCLDAMDEEILKKKETADFEINYFGEARLGDEVEIRSSRNEEVLHFLAYNHSSNRECFRAMMLLR